MPDLPIISLGEFNFDELCDYYLTAEVEVTLKRRLEDVVNVVMNGQVPLSRLYQVPKRANDDGSSLVQLLIYAIDGVTGESNTWEPAYWAARCSTGTAIKINDNGYFIGVGVQKITENFVQVAISVTKTTCQEGDGGSIPETAISRRYREFVVEKGK